MSGRHARPDPITVVLAGSWIAAGSVLLACLGLCARESIPSSPNQASRPVPASTSDALASET